MAPMWNGCLKCHGLEWELELIKYKIEEHMTSIDYFGWEAFEKQVVTGKYNGTLMCTHPYVNKRLESSYR